MITIADLKKSFGETIACDIPSLTINDGDILGLVGNNGAGKTTLFRMMLDLLLESLNGCLHRRGVPHRLPHTRGILCLHRQNYQHDTGGCR